MVSGKREKHSDHDHREQDVNKREGKAKTTALEFVLLGRGIEGAKCVSGGNIQESTNDDNHNNKHTWRPTHEASERLIQGKYIFKILKSSKTLQHT